MTNVARVAAATAAVLALAVITLRADGAAQSPGRAAAVFGVDVVRAYPHDRDAFTQGLIFRDGFIYESTGLNGRSSLRKVDLQTGKVLQQRNVEARYFAEGLTDWGSELFQLTWSSNVGLVYDLASFEPRRSFAYPGEGWGLTHDATSLIMSDGSDQLRFLDPVTLSERRRITVTDGGKPIRALNELEFIHGVIWANVWLTDRIATIDPQTGSVATWLELEGLNREQRRNGDDVLNGIAFDAATGRIFVTGKLWPTLFEIRPKHPTNR